MSERSRPQPPSLLRVILPLSLVALYLPLLVMLLASFRAQDGSFTLQWYSEVFQDPVLWAALSRSLIVGVGSALGATVLGLLGALVLDKWIFVASVPLRSLSTLSLMLPELVLALSLLSWFAMAGIPLSLGTVVTAHITLTLPFVILVIGARLKDLDSSVEDAARDLGANEWQILSRVTVPLLGPAIMTAFVLAFLLSFDDFLITFYTNGAGSDTLPVRLYSLMKTGLTPKVQALSTLMLILSVSLIGILFRMRGIQALTQSED